MFNHKKTKRDCKLRHQILQTLKNANADTSSLGLDLISLSDASDFSTSKIKSQLSILAAAGEVNPFDNKFQISDTGIAAFESEKYISQIDDNLMKNWQFWLPIIGMILTIITLVYNSCNNYKLDKRVSIIEDSLKIKKHE